MQHNNTYHLWYSIKKHPVPMFSALRVLVSKLPCGRTSSWKIKIKYWEKLWIYSNMWVYIYIYLSIGRTWKNTRTHVPPGTYPASDAAMTHGKNHDQSLMYLLLQCLLVASMIGSMPSCIPQTYSKSGWEEHIPRRHGSILHSMPFPVMMVPRNCIIV